MANDSTNSKVISRDNTGFPPYLDFDVLRTSSIDYLSGLTGKVWTDYNVHDPGITILEMLIYAILDLGYRTNLPAKDIFTRNPDDISKENNFFTPAEIFACNPLTILDFRKMLIDIDGVKNAWLTVAEDYRMKDFCNKDAKPVIGKDQAPCKSFINGLYHISLELDEFSERSQKDILDDVRNSLLCHRNLCEDFIDISVLCRLDIGVCANIELEAGADAEEVYRNIVLALQEFFAPAPRYYTLQQLLEKKSIEDIFAGRPYNLEQSHGFVDTEEFENITLKTEIHLSDIYNLVLSIDGVQTIRKLRITQDGQYYSGDWQFKIPDRFVPRFSTDLSSLQFYSNGISIPLDLKKNDSYFKAVSKNTGKILRDRNDLDLAIPKGSYHNDLAEYYSIQNEFPLVYGIGQGGLPNSTLPARQAQAMQLKGYLLFFDHLLANYLSQLSHLRNLFSFRSPAMESDRATYFLNPLNSVPDFDRLIWNIANEKGESNAGKNGSIFGYPVNKADFEKLIQSAGFSSGDIEKLQQQYPGNTLERYRITAGILQNDFTNKLYTISPVVHTSDNKCFCYINTSSEDIILTGSLFQDDQEALRQINLLTDLAISPESYYRYVNNGSFKFNIQLNLKKYSDYLQLIVEDKELYRTRRDGLLNHLLARFAEKFTDFAMLSFNFLGSGELTDQVIQKKENFLSQYPLLSSNRGKAFNYRKNKANNISGFERRFRAIAGIEDKPCSSLCNFEVIAYENTYSVQLKLAGVHLFDAGAGFEGLDKARQGIQSIFSSLSNSDNYQTAFVQHENKFQLQIRYGNNKTAFYPALANEEDMTVLINNLVAMFSLTVPANHLIVSRYVYRLQLEDSNKNPVSLSTNSFTSEQEALAAALSDLRTPMNASKWQVISAEKNPSGKFSSNNKKKPEQLIDLDNFKIDINNNIVDKPDKFNYELLDKNNAFKFRSLNEFNSEKQARANCYELLLLMVNRDNFKPANEGRRNKIHVFKEDKPIAECLNRLDSAIKASEFCDKVCSIVNNSYYLLKVMPIPSLWKFTYLLGFEHNRTLYFESKEEFGLKAEAEQAADQFNKGLDNIELEVIDNKYSLTNSANKRDVRVVLVCTHAGPEIEKMSETEKLSLAKQLLSSRKEINDRLQSVKSKPFEEGIVIDQISSTGQYVYRLVDKDKLYAFHSVDPTSSSSDQLDTLYDAAITGYQVLDICLGGDNTEQYTNAGLKQTLYRYLIKCHGPFGPFKGDSVLFKSIQGYASTEDAEAAFNNNYLFILKQAFDATSYGAGKYISLDEPTPDKAGSGTKNESVVFVPAETKGPAGGTDEKAIAALILAAKSHPVRVLVKCGDEFNRLFPKESCTIKNECPKKPDQYAYYFALYNIQSGVDDWQSVKSYETIQEARNEFWFFVMLLWYKGNYYINQGDKDKPAVYIREVLAESSRRFTTSAEAWGSGGVEKFICAAQSENAFHSYINQQSCSYTYYLSCDKAVHPCRYDGPAARDEAMEKLFEAFRNQQTDKVYRIVSEGVREIIYGMDNNPLAVIYKEDPGKAIPACKRLMELFQLAANDSNYEVLNSQYRIVKKLKDNKTVPIAEPYDASIKREDWKNKLLELAYYYPVKEYSADNFYIEIKYPKSDQTALSKEPASCGCVIPVTSPEDGGCYLAWHSSGCFSSCEDAFDEYEKIIKLYGDYKNYRAFFDCVCYSFGISLQADKDIVAYNPQRYGTADNVCDALHRCKKLINREGIYLAEHILLRPRTANDCACTYSGRGDFYKQTNCTLPSWEEEVFTNGILNKSEICFVPGNDPFSFIATIVLPAWPERFRKKENRARLEDMLNREVPAHILIRILWLKPYDICHFETLYNQWKTELLKTSDGKLESAACDLMKFLFETDFSCLEDCTDCLPCMPGNTVAGCVDISDKTKSLGEYQWLESINELFGWHSFICGEQESELKMVVANTGSKKEIPVPKTTTPEPVAVHDIKLGVQETALLNKRLSGYKKKIGQIIKTLNDNPLAEKAKRLLDGKMPGEITNVILNDLLETENSQMEKSDMSPDQKLEIIKNLIWAYLDKIVFLKGDVSEIKSIAGSLDKMRAAHFDMQDIYNEWNPGDLKKYETTASISVIREELVKN